MATAMATAVARAARVEAARVEATAGAMAEGLEGATAAATAVGEGAAEEGTKAVERVATAGVGEETVGNQVGSSGEDSARGLAEGAHGAEQGEDERGARVEAGLQVTQLRIVQSLPLQQ